MVLKIKNSFGNKIEEFKPIKGNFVGMYTCGPTVYNYAHIGNFRAYVWEDLLKRYLKFLGYQVKHVMNLTDVDDKTIKGAIENKVSLYEYTKKYKDSFFEDIKTLNIIPADIYPSATENISEIIKLIEILLRKKIAYKGDDNSIYFSIKKFPDYGKLANINLEKLKEGIRIKNDEYEKKGAGDFALWKYWNDEDGPIYWESKLGKGRPGWHIECSAMSIKYLGESFDIHCGGIDNKFPHHENEIAQSQGVTNKRFVKYWLHCEHLLVDGKKMSKSLGNFYTLRDLLNMNLEPKAIRYTLLNSYYRRQLNFTIESVKDSKRTLQTLQRTIQKLREIIEKENEIKNTGKKEIEKQNIIKNIIDDALEEFKEKMNNDLNVPLAMSVIFNFNKKINKLIDDDAINKKDSKEIIEFFKKIDSVLGVIEWNGKFFELNDEQKKLLEEREIARKEKNFKKSDEIREQLQKQGITLIDNKDGTTKFEKNN